MAIQAINQIVCRTQEGWPTGGFKISAYPYIRLCVRPFPFGLGLSDKVNIPIFTDYESPIK